jgi:hypothetical protein
METIAQRIERARQEEAPTRRSLHYRIGGRWIRLDVGSAPSNPRGDLQGRAAGHATGDPRSPSPHFEATS